MTEHHRENQEKIDNLSPDSIPALVVAKKQKTVDRFSDTYGTYNEFPTDVSESFPEKDILYIATISQEEYQNLRQKCMESPLPNRYKQHVLSSRDYYLLESIAKVLARKAINGLIDRSSAARPSMKEKMKAFFSRFLD